MPPDDDATGPPAQDCVRGAGPAGVSLSTIGKLPGHNKIETTSRHAHLARDSIEAPSARVADCIGTDILDAPAPTETAPA